jgi:hypothetical protein
MSGLREALVNGLTHYNFCFAEIHASEPSIAMPEEVELVADAVLRVLAEHGDTQHLREQIAEAIRYVDENADLDRVMAVVAPIVAARDAATERAERTERAADSHYKAWIGAKADLAAARQQLDQVRALVKPDNGNALIFKIQIRRILDGIARPAGHDETGQ